MACFVLGWLYLLVRSRNSLDCLVLVAGDQTRRSRVDGVLVHTDIVGGILPFLLHQKRKPKKWQAAKPS
ncbi:hypothetical protein BH23PAT2_BH23PAT2_09350 [soil metagenome]